MVTYNVKKMMTTCSPMIEQFFDTMIVASSDRVVITTHPNIKAGNCIEPLIVVTETFSVFGDSPRHHENREIKQAIF